MSLITLRWIVSLVFFSMFVVGSIINAAIVFYWLTEGRKGSGIPFVPAVCGALSFGLVPVDSLRSWWWIPFLIDVLAAGTIFVVARLLVLRVLEGIGSLFRRTRD